MKIGILTFHLSNNYGSVFQTYALQKYLADSYPEIEFEEVNFIPPNLDRQNSLFENNLNIKSLLKNVVKIPLIGLFKKRTISFNEFRKDNIRIAGSSITEENSDLIEDYDGVIVGSDQIWNPRCLDFSWVYYLENINIPLKISYSPSLGTPELTEMEADRIRENIQQFDYCSVREPASQDLLNMNLEVTPDPTLLLTRQDYTRLSSGRHPKQDYIFLYVIDTDPEMIELAIQISKLMDYPIYTVISSPNSFRLLKYRDIKFYNSESPGDFISLISNAKYVLTNSFHGTVFSLILEKDFSVLTKQSKEYLDYRIDNILSELNLNDRKISSVDQYLVGERSIDYEDFSNKIDQIKKKGEQFLSRAVKDILKNGKCFRD